MSQASSSNARNRCSSTARSAQEPGPLAVVDAAPLASAIDLQAQIDDVIGLSLIRCPDCRDVRVFAATTKSGSNKGKRFLKCPRKSYGNVSAVAQFALPKFCSCLP